jgi:DnaK suppressor protein
MWEAWELQGEAMNKPTPDAERRLLDLKGQLLADAACDDATGTVELDQSRVGRLSRMDAMQAQAMAQASASRRQQRLRQVNAALERVADGDYGVCLECDGDINPKRLEIDPVATLCIDCASRQEE